MKTGGRRIALPLIILGGGVLGAWLAFILPPWLREERMIAQLKSPDSNQRTKAAKTLAELGLVKAIPGLLELKNRDPNHGETMDLLRSIIEKRGTEAVPPLIGQLRNSKFGIRAYAAELLGDLGTEARMAIPPLKELLKDSDPSVRGQAAAALFEIGGESFGSVLVQFSKEPGTSATLVVKKAIQRMALDEVHLDPIPYLIQGLESESAKEILKCLDRLMRHGGAAGVAVPAVIAKAKDPSIAIRRAALETLAVIGSDREDVQQLLIGALGDPEARIRSEAAIGLWKMGPRAAPALPALKRLLESDPDETVRIWVACAVHKLDPDNPMVLQVTKAARDSLMKRALSTLRGNQIQIIHTGYIDIALFSLGIEKAQLDVFIDALKSTDRRCREQALVYFEILGRTEKAALAALIEALRGPDREFRAQVAQSLGAIGPDAAEAVPALQEALKSRNAEIRYQARRALTLIEGDRNMKP
jgi:HEAT repeat protein